MNLDLSDDQRMLKDSVDRLIAEQYPFDQRHRRDGQPQCSSRAIWQSFVELGLTMIPFAQDLGGLGLGGVETMLVGEAFGRGLVVEPYLASVVLAGMAIAHAADAETAIRELDPIITGAGVSALADRAQVGAVADGEMWRLDGQASLVIGGDVADRLVIPAGDALFLVPVATAGVSRRSYRLHGGGGAADFALAGVVVPVPMRLAKAGALERALQAGIAYLAAEAVGAMQAALDITVEYLKTRVQFGQPIGTNQALQHRAAEMLVEVEQARSAAIYAALLASEPSAVERARGHAAVKAVVGKSGRFVAQSAVQLHGGIGVSEEHIISHYFRRLTAIGMLLGDTGKQLARLSDLGGFTQPLLHGSA